MAERIPQILKFVPHLNRRGVILVKRVYADENGPQLSAGVYPTYSGRYGKSNSTIPKLRQAL
jgi:hypothetical protein